MRADILLKLCLFLGLLLLQTEAGCFPKRKRKIKANILAKILSNKTSTEQREGESQNQGRSNEEGNVMPQTVQTVERAVETSKDEPGGGGEERRHGDAIQILARVLSNITERPMPHRGIYFAYRAGVEWSTVPIIEHTRSAFLSSGIFNIRNKLKYD